MSNEKQCKLFPEFDDFSVENKMDPADLIGYLQGQAYKEAGMEAAARHREIKLILARQQVREAALSREDRTASADDTVVKLGPAAGSLFKGKEWCFVDWKVSRRASNHGRPIRLWRLS